jgi:hypothetical protein
MFQQHNRSHPEMSTKKILNIWTGGVGDGVSGFDGDTARGLSVSVYRSAGVAK